MNEFFPDIEWSFLITYLIAWFPMLILAVLNGGIRDLTYQKRMGELRAHQLSTIILIILLCLYFRILFAIYPIEFSFMAFVIGGMWLILTVAFEFSFGIYTGQERAEMLADYNLGKGRLWPLVLLWLTIGPYVFYKFLS